MYPKITRPKYPLIRKAGHRHFFNMLVQLGNDIITYKIPISKIGEIQIYEKGSCWWYAIYENPDYLTDSNV